MAEQRQPSPAPGPDRGLERLLMLTDGVFAIALTLLAIELHLPADAEHRSRGELLRAILAEWPHVLAFALSFSVLALYWSAHHRLFRHVVRADGGLVWLTLAFLLTVSFLPFPTGVIGAHFVDPAAALLYGGSLFVTNAVFWATWRYATAERRRLAPGLDLRLVRHYQRVLGVPAVVFLGTALLAAVNLLTPRGRVPFVAAVVVAFAMAFVYLVLAVQDWREPA